MLPAVFLCKSCASDNLSVGDYLYRNALGTLAVLVAVIIPNDFDCDVLNLGNACISDNEAVLGVTRLFGRISVNGVLYNGKFLARGNFFKNMLP